MKNLWKYSVGLSVGLIVSTAQGEEVRWTAAAPKPAGLIASSQPTIAVSAPPVKPAAEPALLPPLQDGFVIPAGHAETLIDPQPPTVQYLDVPTNPAPLQPLPGTLVRQDESNPPPIATSKADDKVGGDKPGTVPAPRPLEPEPDGSFMIEGDTAGPVVSTPNGNCFLDDGCGSCGCGCGSDHGGCPSNRFYASTEYLHWFMRPATSGPGHHLDQSGGSLGDYRSSRHHGADRQRPHRPFAL